MKIKILESFTYIYLRKSIKLIKKSLVAQGVEVDCYKTFIHAFNVIKNDNM